MKTRALHTQQEHLNLISLHHLVALQLVLNLLVAGLALLVLSTHSATHFGGCCRRGVVGKRGVISVVVERWRASKSYAMA